MIITCLPTHVLAADTPSTYGKIITSTTTYIAQADENIKVSGEGVVANITLSGITINKSSDVYVSAIRIENGAIVHLTILGTNTLRGADGCAGISLDETSTLIITYSSTGTLNSYGGLMAAGIGGDAECNSGTITIENGTINAYGGENAGQFADDRGGAGIGGGNNGGGGNITINGGNIYADGGDTSASIGGGNDGATGTIIINDSTFRASAGYKAAAIGGVGGCMCKANQAVLYEYQKTRKADAPDKFLKGFEGTLVCDGYQVYHTLENQADTKFMVAGCWAHYPNNIVIQEKMLRSRSTPAFFFFSLNNLREEIQVIHPFVLMGFHQQNLLRTSTHSRLLACYSWCPE